VRRTQRSARRRRGFIAVAALATLGLIAGACGDKKDDSEGATGGDTAAPGADTTTATEPGTDTTAAEAPATTTPEVTPEPGGRLIIAGEAEANPPWTPEKVQCDTYCQMRMRAMFDPLVVIGTDFEIYPYLAESVEPNEDFTVWTIKLREGITFHDGTPLNADAAIKNLQVTGSGFLISNLITDVAKEADGSLKIVKLDDMSFEIHTGKGGDPNQPVPWPSFPYFLTTQWSFMASPAWIDAYRADPALETQPVGTGPFKYQSFEAGNNLVVVKNEDYWLTDADGNALPYLDEIEFRVIVDSQARQQALEAGNIDLMATSDGEVIADFREQADEFPMVEQSEYTETDFGLIHVSKPGPLQSRNFRCALEAAVDDQALIDTVGGGIQTIANGPFSPGQEGFLEDNGNPGYDPERAQEFMDAYLAEPGAVQQPKVLWGTTNTANNLVRAQFLQDAWNAIGVDTEVVQVEQSSFITTALLGDPSFEIFGWRLHQGVVLDNQYHWWHEATALPDGQIALNFGRMKDPVITELLDKARSETDPDARRGYAEDVNRRFAEQCWMLPFNWTIWGMPHKPSVQGIGQSPIPDAPEGVYNRDGAGFPGQVWTPTLWVQQ
jgi:peptide/nickel transport system substrate-binding protein